MKTAFIIKKEKYSIKETYLIAFYYIMGYEIKFINRNHLDNRRGHRANIISWIDDLPEFPKDFKKVIDTPIK